MNVSERKFCSGISDSNLLFVTEDLDKNRSDFGNTSLASILEDSQFDLCNLLHGMPDSDAEVDAAVHGPYNHQPTSVSSAYGAMDSGSLSRMPQDHFDGDLLLPDAEANTANQGLSDHHNNFFYEDDYVDPVLSRMPQDEFEDLLEGDETEETPVDHLQASHASSVEIGKPNCSTSLLAVEMPRDDSAVGQSLEDRALDLFGTPSREELAATKDNRGKNAIRRFYKLYSQLVEYKREKGNCNVPQSKKGSPLYELGTFVNKCRTQKKKRGRLLPTTRMVEALNFIGFEWELQVDWDEMFARLEGYYEKNGHSNVPTKGYEDPALGNWVSKQRDLKRKDRLTDDKIHRLESVGFEWALTKRGRNHGGRVYA